MSHTKKPIRAIESFTFLKNLRLSLYGSIGVNPARADYEVNPSSPTSKTADISLKLSPVLEQEWSKKRILATFLEYCKNHYYHSQECEDRIILTRKWDASKFEEKYSVKIQFRQNSCGILIEDILEKTETHN